MPQHIAIPDELYAQAAEMAEADQIPVDEYIVRLLTEQLNWKRYAILQSDREKRRYAGVQERMPDSETDFENEQ